jgi:GAF domain-containing protein
MVEEDGGVEPLPETREALAEYMSLDSPDIDDLIRDLAQGAGELVPDLVGLSLGLDREGLTFTLVASGDGTALVDAAQYLDGGPCVEVTEGRAPVLEMDFDDPLDEERWRLYAEVGAAAGVRSSLSLPIYLGDRLVGGLNLYAGSSEAFHGHHAELAALVSASTAEAVSNADLSFSSRSKAQAAPGILRERLEVETAIGLLAGLRGLEVAEAEQRLDDAALRAGVDRAAVAHVLVRVLRQDP